MFLLCLAADAISELTKGNVQGLTLNKNGLITAGQVPPAPFNVCIILLTTETHLQNVSQESLVHCLQIKGTEIDITHTWQLERPITTVKYSPDNETLLLSSNMVSVVRLSQYEHFTREE